MRNESTRQAWKARIQEQSNSGVAVRPWCVREGIRESSFQYWRKRLTTRAPASQLIALPMVTNQPDLMLELCTPNGYVLRLSSQDQVPWLASVLEALR